MSFNQWQEDLDSSFPRLNTMTPRQKVGTGNGGYIQPPPIQSNAPTTGGLYPTIPSTSGPVKSSPARGLAGPSPGAANQQKINNIGTLSVSELKKQTKPLDLASTFIESYLEKDQKYPDLDRIIMRELHLHTRKKCCYMLTRC